MDAKKEKKTIEILGWQSPLSGAMIMQSILIGTIA